MAKMCGKCGLEKPSSEFARKGITKKGATKLHSWCKSCNRIYQKSHYIANMAKYKTKAKTWRSERKAATLRWLQAYLLAHPCVDCGESDPVVLQFDHVRGAKLADIAQMIQNHVRLEVLETEAAKCDIRCANCHIRRTAQQYGWWRLKIGFGLVDEWKECAAFQAAS